MESRSQTAWSWLSRPRFPLLTRMMVGLIHLLPISIQRLLLCATYHWRTNIKHDFTPIQLTAKFVNVKLDRRSSSISTGQAGSCFSTNDSLVSSIVIVIPTIVKSARAHPFQLSLNAFCSFPLNEPLSHSDKFEHSIYQAKECLFVFPKRKKWPWWQQHRPLLRIGTLLQLRIRMMTTIWM